MNMNINMSVVKDFLAKHWPVITAVLLAFFIGAGLSWKLKPDQVRVEEKVVTKTVDHDVIHEVVRTEYVQVKATEVKDNSHKVIVTQRKPDGTVTTTTTIDNHVDTSTNTKTDTEKNTKTDGEHVATSDTTSTKITEPVLAKWHAGILLGVAPRFDAPAQTPVMLGLELEHRFAGPFFLGAWVMAGSPVVGQFKVTNAAVGLKLGVEFP